MCRRKFYYKCNKTEFLKILKSVFSYILCFRPWRHFFMKNNFSKCKKKNFDSVGITIQSEWCLAFIVKRRTLTVKVLLYRVCHVWLPKPLWIKKKTERHILILYILSKLEEANWKLHLHRKNLLKKLIDIILTVNLLWMHYS